MPYQDNIAPRKILRKHLSFGLQPATVLSAANKQIAKAELIASQTITIPTNTFGSVVIGFEPIGELLAGVQLNGNSTFVIPATRHVRVYGLVKISSSISPHGVLLAVVRDGIDTQTFDVCNIESSTSYDIQFDTEYITSGSDSFSIAIRASNAGQSAQTFTVSFAELTIEQYI